MATVPIAEELDAGGEGERDGLSLQSRGQGAVADDDEARRERGYGYIDGFATLSETASPGELRAYLKRHGLTQVKAAGICKVNDRTMRRWALGAVPVPRGAWELLKLKVAQTEKAGSQ